ncbi:MAG: helix-turn-helix transcriptional regulator [Gemmatimonadales bacterium]|nr:helix-turn-helix transcriptional regulator [Gemmatimonadales bacterium]
MPPVQLSPREDEMLRLLALGRTTKAAARDLGISYHTGAHHVRLAMRRLGVHSRIELIAQAWAHGVVSPPVTPMSENP